MKEFIMDYDSIEANINIGKGILLQQLKDDGKLTEEELKDYYLNYAFIIKKPSFFAKLWKKLSNGNDEKRVVLVKQLTIKAEE